MGREVFAGLCLNQAQQTDITFKSRVSMAYRLHSQILLSPDKAIKHLQIAQRHVFFYQLHFIPGQSILPNKTSLILNFKDSINGNIASQAAIGQRSPVRTSLFSDLAKEQSVYSLIITICISRLITACHVTRRCISADPVCFCPLNFLSTFGAIKSQTSRSNWPTTSLSGTSITDAGAR